MKAVDNGDPQMTTVVPVKFDTRFGLQSSVPAALQSEYRYIFFCFLCHWSDELHILENKGAAVE